MSLRADDSRRHSRRASPGRTELALYVAAAAIYIAVGVLVVEFMLASVTALGFLLLVIWIIPSLRERFGRHRKRRAGRAR